MKSVATSDRPARTVPPVGGGRGGRSTENAEAVEHRHGGDPFHIHSGSLSEREPACRHLRGVSAACHIKGRRSP
jgi:hypothetical protein